MTTKYFNKYDRERMMILALLISRLPDIVDNFSTNLKVLAQSELTADEADESNDTFLDLMAVVQEERCYQCNLDNIEACPYRVAMLNWSVPVFNEHCEEGECPYKVVLD